MKNHLWYLEAGIKKLNVFTQINTVHNVTTKNSPCYIVTKLERNDKDYKEHTVHVCSQMINLYYYTVLTHIRR